MSLNGRGREQHQQGILLGRTKPIQIRTVTRHNYIVEFNAIGHLINNTPFRYVSIDTEYPGQIFRSAPRNPHNPAAAYSLMKSNVYMSKLIQVGITISDGLGNLPDFRTNFVYVWEFLLSDFQLGVDACVPSSIEVLQSQGVDFERNRQHGIWPGAFARRLVTSGLMGRASSPVTWITFNGGYDLGYMIKAFTNAALPDNLTQFMGRVRELFGMNVFDAKHMTTRLCRFVGGGIDRVAAQLGVVRVIKPGHRTVSNALVGLQVFNRIRAGRELVVMQLAGQIYNLCD